MSRRTSVVTILIGMLVTAVAMVSVVWLARGSPHDLGSAVVVGTGRGDTAVGSVSPQRSADPRTSGPSPSASPEGTSTPGPRSPKDSEVSESRPSGSPGVSGSPEAKSVATARKRAEPVKPPPPPRGGDDDDDGDDD